MSHSFAWLHGLDIPKLGTGIGIESKNPVGDRGHVDDVMSSIARNIDICKIQGLDAYNSIGGIESNLTKRVGVDIGWSESCFVRVPTLSHIAVLKSGYIQRRRRRATRRA
jgi:hypothetical protein